jgi:subtilase family serine protease
LNLAIGLPLRNGLALTNLLARLYDPSKPEYHRYLTPEQFTAAFGPSEEDYQALVAYAKANGFRITGTHSNRTLLDVQASVEEIERAFHTTLSLYRHPVENRTFFAPASEPALEPPVPILHISGLNNFSRPRHYLKTHSITELDNPKPAVGSGPNGTFWGSDFRGAYAAGARLNGAGQMVGLLEFDGYYPSDPALYRVRSGITAVPLINVLLDDYDGVPGQGNVEVALDIEVTMAMAPGLSAIIVYEGGPTGIPNDILNRMATDNLAKQLSSSWSFGVDASTAQIFQQFAAQGQSYFNASGDDGAYVGGPPSPFDYPFVTSVGGTLLHTSRTGEWQSESAWNDTTGALATGGGVSASFSIPTWQQGVDMTTNLGSLSMRNLPDVAMIADLVWSIYDNGTASFVSGTSISAPLWAALIAMANQQAASLGQPSVGFINPAVYAIGQGPGYTTNFHDITTGSNTNSTSPSKFFAVDGYDLCTGWGTPIGQNLINTLVPRPPGILVTNAGATLISEGCSPANGAVDPGEAVTVNFSLMNLGASSTTGLVAVLQADSGVLSPSAPQTYGLLTGGGPVVTRAFSFIANGQCGSNLTATLQLSDGTNSLGNLSFNFTLGTPANVFAENFDAVRAPTLPLNWTTFRSGAVSNWITAIPLTDSAPNAAFVFETTNAGFAELISPPIQVSTPAATFKFHHNYNMETYVDNPTNAYDGGVLEIQIGSGPYQDVLASGGSFISGGYNKVLKSDPAGDNPLDGRQVWSGLSGGFITTEVGLPASAVGQSVHLKWRLATDGGNFLGGTGWYIDSVTVQEGYTCCNSNGVAPSISLQPANSVVAQHSNAAFQVAAQGSPPPTYQWFFNGFSLPGATNSTLALTNVQPQQAGPYLVIVTNFLGAATSSVAQLTVLVPPTISLSALNVSAGNVSLTLTGISGLNYSLEYKNQLSDSNWIPVLPALPGSGGSLVLQDTNSPAYPWRFYRVRTF